jgi:hypothetical protein
MGNVTAMQCLATWINVTMVMNMKPSAPMS